jgi:non-specific serine/threonine protein kinase
MLGQIGPYRLLRKIGEGGMGIVYAAHDERLDRSVAIKTIRDSVDDSARERFFREARAAASVSHPNVCQLFDIGDSDGKPFIVMELLDGEPLSERLSRGPLPLPDAAQFCLAILTALETLHARGVVHRDLKPSNVFLTRHGVKLLDFGLARATSLAGADTPTLRVGALNPVTATGVIVGTPRYMAPEQLLGAQVDQRTDLFAGGAVLFEMVSGRPPFEGDHAMKLFHDICYERAPTLGGSAAVAAVNRIIQRALAKRPEERYQSAAAMAQDVREILMISDVASPLRAHTVTRIAVLPFRMLRPDQEVDFLAEALPEAVTASLASIGTLIVRSALAARKAAGLDLAEIARHTDVDVILTGTILRGGEQLRVTTQLVEVPAGTILWSLSSQGSLTDIFELQDRLAQRIVESLELPLSDRERRLLKGEIPANARAHEFYLRATQAGQTPDDWPVASDLYKRVLDEDPRFAPALARKARLHILMGKYGGHTTEQFTFAETDIRRALQINPELPLAQSIYAQLEVHQGNAQQAMVRLLDIAGGGTNDPAIYTGLVMACRFCGLLAASASAHEQAVQLDPAVSTSVQHTYWMMGDYERALATVDRARDIGGDEAWVLESMGRPEEALRVLEQRAAEARRRTTAHSRFELDLLEAFLALYRAKNYEAARPMVDRQRLFPDGEGHYYLARTLAFADRHDEAVTFLESAERLGFFCYPIFLRDRWLDPLRGRAGFNAVVRRVEQRHRDAAAAFAAHPASRILEVGRRK